MSRATIAIFTVFICATPAISIADCTGARASSVLQCMTAAFEERDSAAYEDLLAQDFQFVYENGEQSTSWDRARDIEGTNTMFSGAATIEFDVTGEPRIRPGDNESLWVVDGMEILIKVIGHDGEEKTAYTEPGRKTEFLVRQRGKEQYQVVEWRDLPMNESQKVE